MTARDTVITGTLGRALLGLGVAALVSLQGCAKRAETRAPDSISMEDAAAYEGDGGGEEAADEGEAADDGEKRWQEGLLKERQDEDSPAPQPTPPEDPLDRLSRYEAMLRSNEGRMRQAGIRLAHLDNTHSEQPAPDPFPGVTTSRPPSPEPKPQTKPKPKKDRATKKKSAGRPSVQPLSPGGGAPVAAPPVDRCQLLCDIAASTCDLEAKICSLADDHDDNPRYAEVCERARQDCAVASQHCTACSAK